MIELGVITLKGFLQDVEEDGIIVKRIFYCSPHPQHARLCSIPVSEKVEESDKHPIWNYKVTGDKKIDISPSIREIDVYRPQDYDSEGNPTAADRVLYSEGYHCGIPTIFELVDSLEEIEKIVEEKERTINSQN